MNEIERAQELQETGEYNAYSALLRINKPRKKQDCFNKKEFYDALRRAYFLKTGYQKKPFDPIHNQPYGCWIKQGLARIETSKIIKKNSQQEITYYVPVFSEEGMKEIEKIINDSNYTLLPQKLELEKQARQPATNNMQTEQQRQASEAARENAMALLNMDKAS